MNNGWKEMELGDVLQKIIGGGTPSKSKSEYWNGDINWCSVKDMSNDKFQISETQDSITYLGLINSASNLIAENTVIISTRMGLGKAFISKKEMAINQDLKALIPNEKINNNFLLWLIIFNKNTLENLGSGATVKGIRLETLKSLKIKLPPLQIQEKIADILSSYDDLIENNLKRIKILEELAQNTYEEWFVRMRFPGFENTAIDKETSLPKGWKIKKLVDIYSIKYGKNLAQTKIQKSGKYKVYGASGFMGFYDDKNCDTKVVLITSRGNGSGQIHRTHETNSFITNNSFIVQNKKEFENISLSYSFEFLKKLNLSRFCSGSAQPQLTNNSMLNIKVKIPSFELLQKYKNFSEPIIDLIDKLYLQNQRLKEARDILLPRLMMGIIDIKS